MPRTVRLTLLAAGVWSAASLARAHHDAPTGLSLVWREAAADVAPIVLTNRGLVFPSGSGPAGAFALRCNDAYDAGTGALPSIVLDASGALVVQSPSGVTITRDQGCTFTRATGLPELPLGGFAQDPATPARLLVSSQDYAGESRVFASEDFGHTWSPRARNAHLSVYDALAFGADGVRVYASGARYDAAGKRLIPTWASSRDGGASFVERDVEGRGHVVLGVHPREVDTVFARETESTGISQPLDFVLRSRDGGTHFERVYAPASVITAFATSPDGSRIYVGTENTGLHVSRDGGATFTRVAAQDVLSVGCLRHRGGALHVCATRAPYTHGVWSTRDDGATFTEQVTFQRVVTEVACSEPVRLCEAPFRAWREAVRGEAAPARDAHGSAGPSIINGEPPDRPAPSSAAPVAEPSPNDEAGGCNVATINVPTRELCWLLALSLLVARRKKPS